MQHSQTLKHFWKRPCGVSRVLPALVLLAGCSLNGPGSNTGSLGVEKEGAKASVKVALLVPLSSQGQPGLIAKSLKQAAELALFERDNPNLQLIVKDDKGTPEGAKAAAEDALGNGATLILGPLFAKSVTAVAPIARKAKVPVVAFSNDRQVAGGGVYLLSFQPTPEVERVVAFAVKQGKRRFAALIPQDALGKVVEPAFRSAVERAGGSVVAVEPFSSSTNAVLEPLRRIAATISAPEPEGGPIDALFVPGGQEQLEAIGRLLPHAKISTASVKLIGTGGLDYPNAGREPALVGAWYPGPDPRGWSEFSQRFGKSYGQAPPRIASLAYDAVNMAIALADASISDGGRYQAAWLTRPNGFTGVDGTFRLLEDGTTDRPLAILEVQRYGATIIDAPPATVSAPAAAVSSGPGSGLFNLFKFQ
jgi:ABC-type branched-subunit amino acid transport system substrate-binding protein